MHVACAHSTNICCIACLCVYSYTVLSFVEIVKELLSDCNLQQCYILSGKFNQDPLENFFGKVRQSGGWSGNPSAKTVEDATNSIRLQTSSVMDEVRGTPTVRRRLLSTVEPMTDDTPLPKRSRKPLMNSFSPYHICHMSHVKCMHYI